MSNSEEVLKNIPETERISSFINQTKNQHISNYSNELGCQSVKSSELKLLGIPYDFNADEFLLSFKQPEIIKFTKRGVSSASATFYDPLGFILPFVMLLRIFLQKIWKQKVDWDEKLSTDLQTEFAACIQGVIIAEIIGLFTGIIFIIIAFKCFKSSSTDATRWFTDWEGPHLPKQESPC